MRCSWKVPGLVLLCVSVLAAPLNSQSTPTPSISLPGSQSPFQGSAPENNATQEVLQIDFKQAIERGLRNNLGLLLAGDQAQTARGQRWHELSELLPNVGVHAEEAVQTESLTALGFRGNLFPAPLPRIIGPFNYFDLRANFSQSVFNFRALERERAAEENDPCPFAALCTRRT